MGDQEAVEKRLQGYRLATAHILYRMPDFPKLLQSFIWQQLDLAPDYPELRKFLDFWRGNLDGELHSVEVAGSQLVAPSEFRCVSGRFRLQ